MPVGSYFVATATSQSPSLLETLATAYNLGMCRLALPMIEIINIFRHFLRLLSFHEPYQMDVAAVHKLNTVLTVHSLC